MTDKIKNINDLIELFFRLDLQNLKEENYILKNIESWARTLLPFKEGDRVQITGFVPMRDGWWSYRESLYEGAKATVKEIQFSPLAYEWRAGIVLDKEWIVATNYSDDKHR